MENRELVNGSLKFGKEVVEYHMMESRPGGFTGVMDRSGAFTDKKNEKKHYCERVPYPFAGGIGLYNDDEKILTNGNYQSTSHVSQTKAGKTVGGQVKGMTGMATLWKYDVPWEEDLEVAYGISVEKGRVKMVFISPNDEITVLTELTEPGRDVGQKELTLEKGESRIKIVASDRAKFDFLLEVHKGQLEGMRIDYRGMAM